MTFGFSMISSSASDLFGHAVVNTGLSQANTFARHPERLSFEILHRQKPGALFAFDVGERADVWMVERG